MQVHWPMCHVYVGFLPTLFFTLTCFFYFPSTGKFLFTSLISGSTFASVISPFFFFFTLRQKVFVLSPSLILSLFSTASIDYLLPFLASNIGSNLDSNGSGRNECSSHHEWVRIERFLLRKKFAIRSFEREMFVEIFLRYCEFKRVLEEVIFLEEIWCRNKWQLL